MDNGLQNSMGFVVMGALWGIYVIAGHFTQGKVDRQRQAKHDESTSSLLKELNAAVSRGEEAVNRERLRNQELYDTQIAQARELGEAKGTIEFERRLREQSEKERDEALGRLESLAIELGNTRKSNEELVQFNKQLLRSISEPQREN